MPSIIIHEKVGEEIGKQIGVHSYNYYLGLLAPDAPNLEEFAPKEERWMAHQRRKDLDEWRIALQKFYESEKDHYPKDFLVGYYLHVLTDIVYDDDFYQPVKEEISKKYPKEVAHNIMRDDMKKYSFDDMHTIKGILEKGNTSYDILNISKERLLKWKNKEILSWKEEKKSEYITDKIIQELTDEVLKEYKETIGE